MCMLCKRKSSRLLCDDCYNKFPIDMKLEYLPLDEHNLYILSLFQNTNRINKNFYNNEISQIFNYFYNLGYHIIFNDTLNYDMDNVLLLDSITKVLNKDILLMTYNVIE